MSSISLSLKMMLAASACAGLTLLACGGDDSGGGSSNSDDDDKPTKDAGKTNKDAGKDAGKKDAGLQIAMVTPGDECDPDVNMGAGGSCEDCDQAPCFSRCEDGVYGDCKSAADQLGELTKDGGLEGLLRDSGLSGILRDAGLGGILADAGLGGILGDAGPIGGACPTEQTCTSSSSGGLGGTIIGLVAPAGQGICTVGEAPKECAAAADCTGGGTCFDGNTLSAQLPGGSAVFGLVGWPTKFCLAPCKP